MIGCDLLLLLGMYVIQKKNNSTPCYNAEGQAKAAKARYEHIFFFFGFESTQLAHQLHQERTQMEVQ